MHSQAPRPRERQHARYWVRQLEEENRSLREELNGVRSEIDGIRSFYSVLLEGRIPSAIVAVVLTLLVARQEARCRRGSRKP